MTKYCVLVKYALRQEKFVTRCFDSMTLRAIYIVGLASEAEIVREWEEA